MILWRSSNDDKVLFYEILIAQDTGECTYRWSDIFSYRKERGKNINSIKKTTIWSGHEHVDVIYFKDQFFYLRMRTA